MLAGINPYEHIGVIYAVNVIIILANEKGEFTTKLRIKGE